MRSFASILLLGFFAVSVSAQPAYQNIDQPPHEYWKRPLKDPFTRIKTDLEGGKLALDYSGEKPFLVSMLKAFNIPVSSQMLVFSTTSLQLRFIKPSNPRALYFNEDLYIGYIPGGRIEVVSLDPEIGGVFYIFDIPRDGQPPRVERSDRCMNCHSAADTGFLPGLVIKSVVPGPTGGSLMSFRIEQSGHAIPFDQRFGGWYLTGKHGITNHWGNLIGRSSPGGLTKQPIEPGQAFSYDRYPVASSDILPQLLHEHQAGFVNRAIEASYRARTILFSAGGKPSAEQAKELDQQANALTRYLLFAEEASLPNGGVEGDAAYKQDFLKDRRAAKNGASLRDFDLQTRLFKHRCSYMIYSNVVQGMPTEMRQRIYRRMAEALSVQKPDPEYAYLPKAEKEAIRTILRETLSDLPRGW